MKEQLAKRSSGRLHWDLSSLCNCYEYKHGPMYQRYEVFLQAIQALLFVDLSYRICTHFFMK
jgi:hypothetical protein